MDFMPKFPLKPAIAVEPVPPPAFKNVRLIFSGDSQVPIPKISDSSTRKTFDYLFKLIYGFDRKPFTDY